MNEPTSILQSKITKLENENDTLKTELAWFRRRDTVWRLRRESQVPNYIWRSLRLTEKLMDCQDEAEMMPWIRDAQQVADGERKAGEVVGMGDESDVAGYDEQDINEQTKSKIRESFEIIRGGKD